jgi:acetyl-CoA synthetase
MNPHPAAAMRRVEELLALYGAPSASAAALLCDRHDPDRIAYHIIAPDLTDIPLTYGELRTLSTQLAAGLAALGVRPGDRVATLMGKSRAYLLTLLATWRLGAVHVPLFTAFAPPAIAQRLTASRTTVVVCDAAQRGKLAPSSGIRSDNPWQIVATGPPTDADTPFASLFHAARAPATAALGGEAPLIEIYTSGTTGTAKGVIVPLRAVAGFQIYAEYGLGILAGDRFWNAADPGWAYGLYFGVIATLSTGVESFLYEGGFSPEATLALLRRYRITNFAAAPTAYRTLRGSALPTDGLVLRCASSAGEPLTAGINAWAADALGLLVHDHYGQTEAGMLINNHQHPALQRPLRQGAMGHTMPGWQAELLQLGSDEPVSPGESGRLAMDLTASPLAWFHGYGAGLPTSAEKFSRDGRWYLTGDVARMDNDGYFYFSARDDDIILMAGYRIGPCDVEAVLLSHPAVTECAVIAVPDETRGEVLEAVVVLEANWCASDDLSEALRLKVKLEFAAHAYPRRVHYVDALPKTVSGKIQRFLVRQQVRARLAKSAAP